MKKKIVLHYAAIVLFSLILFILGAVFLVQSNLQNVTELNLRNYLELVDAAYTRTSDEAAVIDEYAGIEDYLRITFIDVEGNVTADSIVVPEDNHLTRPEIVEPGTVAIRHSDTLGKRMMYLAETLADGSYLRVAIPLSSVAPFFNNFLFLSILVGCVIVVVAVFFLSISAERTILPLKETVGALRSIVEGHYAERLPLENTEESNQLINEINEIAHLLSENIRSLGNEKRKLDFILDHMDQGLCILDTFGRVVLVNRFVKNLLGFNDQENKGRNYLFLFRDKTIQLAIHDALEKGIGMNGTYADGDRYYSVTVIKNPDDFNGTESVLLIYTDITQAKTLEILKRDFFVNASHELKSPLTSIIGASELIAADMTKSPEETRDLAARIIQEARRMNNLVNDMLDLSKYEQGMETNNIIAVDLADVIKEAGSVFASVAAERNIRILFQIVSATVRANYEDMIQLVRNLIDNSIKYGVENGHVWVALRKTTDAIELEVADDGIGISKADQARVFERFYRVDKARSKKIGGTGLGLAIVKHICLAYQGKITLESELGKGTKMIISFPL